MLLCSIAMQWAEFGGIFEKFVDNPNTAWPDRIVCHYFKQMLYGVRWLHQLGFVHRDLKAEK